MSFIHENDRSYPYMIMDKLCYIICKVVIALEYTTYYSHGRVDNYSYYSNRNTHHHERHGHDVVNHSLTPTLC